MFFQNIFQFQFKQTLLSQTWDYSQSFSIGANQNNSNYMVCYNSGPWNLNGVDAGGNPLNILSFYIAPNQTPQIVVPPIAKAPIDYTQRTPYTLVSVDIAPYAANLNSVTPQEVVNAINGNVMLNGGCNVDPANPYPSNTCSALWTAEKYNLSRGTQNVRLVANPVTRFAFIGNTGAETVMGWNKNAPVIELPSIALKYCLQMYAQYPALGSVQRILALDPTNPVDAQVITDSGFNPLSPTPDWKLLGGGNDLYTFSKTVVVSGTQYYTIEYMAGCDINDPATKTYYTTDGAVPPVILEKCVTPYILTAADLVVPF
jgi:hypothetical protein